MLGSLLSTEKKRLKKFGEGSLGHSFLPSLLVHKERGLKTWREGAKGNEMPEQEVSPKYKLSGSRRWDLCFQLGAESMGASARETRKIPIITRFWKGGVPQIANRLQTLLLPTSIKKNKNKKLNPTVPSPYFSSLCKEGKNQGTSGTKKNE